MILLGIFGTVGYDEVILQEQLRESVYGHAVMLHCCVTKLVISFSSWVHLRNEWEGFMGTASVMKLQCSKDIACSTLCGACFLVSIVHEDWCWKNKSLELEVMEEDVSGIEFRQTGYMLRCSLSHAITLVCM